MAPLTSPAAPCAGCLQLTQRVSSLDERNLSYTKLERTSGSSTPCWRSVPVPWKLSVTSLLETWTPQCCGPTRLSPRQSTGRLVLEPVPSLLSTPLRGSRRHHGQWFPFEKSMVSNWGKAHPHVHLQPRTSAFQTSLACWMNRSFLHWLDPCSGAPDTDGRPPPPLAATRHASDRLLPLRALQGCSSLVHPADKSSNCWPISSPCHHLH